MFKFDLSKISIINVKLSSVTTALGGSITVVEETTVDGVIKVKSSRIAIPFAVARNFIKMNKKSRFFVPIEVAVTFYDDIAVCIEKKLPNAIYDDNGIWQSNSDYTTRRVLPKLVSNTEKGQWYTDGHCIYQIPDDWADSSARTSLSQCGSLYAVTVLAVKFSQLMLINLMSTPGTRSCLAYKPSKGKPILSPPIWVNILDIRNNTFHTSKNDQTKVPRFTQINNAMFVNLDFVLVAAKVIGKCFGYQHINFLRLNDHMINLNTVNLPNVDRSIRATYDIGISFLASAVWLMGWFSRCDNLAHYEQLRTAMKHLCTKCLFIREQLRKTHNTQPPQVVSFDTALSSLTTLTIDKLNRHAYFANKMGKKDAPKQDIAAAVNQFITGVEQ